MFCKLFCSVKSVSSCQFYFVSSGAFSKHGTKCGALNNSVLFSRWRQTHQNVDLTLGRVSTSLSSALYIAGADNSSVDSSFLGGCGVCGHADCARNCPEQQLRGTRRQSSSQCQYLLQSQHDRSTNTDEQNIVISETTTAEIVILPISRRGWGGVSEGHCQCSCCWKPNHWYWLRQD